MTAAPVQPVTKPRTPRRRLAAWLSLATVVLLAVMAAGYYGYFPSRIGAAQPLPFSHRFHVTEKHVSCVLCHPGVIDSARAGVPPLETCMLCHKNVIVTYPKIRALREAYDTGRPVRWVRANHVPEFVYFSHERHVRQGFDCGRCHGDVSHMDRIEPSPEITMGFCVQCHRDENASHDCLICHR
jgi:hypothetical protein